MFYCLIDFLTFLSLFTWSQFVKIGHDFSLFLCFFFLSFFSKIRSLCCFLAKQSEQISDQWSLMIKDKIIIIKSISHHHQQHKAIFICLRLFNSNHSIVLPMVCYQSNKQSPYRSIFFSECYRYDIWHLFMKGMNYFGNFIYLFIVINFLLK